MANAKLDCHHTNMALTNSENTFINISQPTPSLPTHDSLYSLYDVFSCYFKDEMSDQTCNEIFQVQYESTLVIFRQCFTLLKVMARGNALVQQRLFDRLDLILSIKGTEPQMAEALIEVILPVSVSNGADSLK